jgi:predicted HTH domain antitoxin
MRSNIYEVIEIELVRTNTTLTKQLVKKIDHYAREMHEDRSTAIRQLLSKAILEMEQKQIIAAFSTKKITIREAANALGVDYWQMQELLEQKGVPITDLTQKEIKERKQEIKKMARK